MWERRSTERNGSKVAALFELQTNTTGLGTVTGEPDYPGADDALVKAAQDGDRGAFGMLYARYARMVHGILLARVPHAAVEDLVQEVFLQALPRLGALRDVSRFTGWLAAIARNRANDFHRQARPDVEFDEEAPSMQSEGGESKNRTPQASAEARAVLEAIRSLPEAYREPLILRLVEGLTGPEIADRTGLTHGSVRVNLHRGMQQLREMLRGKAGSAASPQRGAE